MQFRFFQLPPELRFCIYCALIDDFSSQLEIHSSETSESGSGTSSIYLYTCSRVVHSFHNLVVTNKQIYQEAGPLLYKSCTFVFQNVRSLQAFILQIGLSIRDVGSIDVLNMDGYGSTCSALCEVSETLSQANSLTQLRVDATTRGSIPQLSMKQLIRVFDPLLKRDHSIHVRDRAEDPSKTSSSSAAARNSSRVYERIYTPPVLYYLIQLSPAC